jgi:WD40 repeat protein
MTQFWDVHGSAADAEFSPDGIHAVVTTEHGETVIYNLLDANDARLVVKSQYLEAASYSPDGSLLATASDDSTAQIFDVSTLVPLAPFTHPDRVKSARLSPDNLRLITACNDGIARIWNIKQGTVELSLRHTAKVRFAEFSHNGRLAATASEDKTACLWDAQTGQMIARLVHPSWVTHIAFSPDDSQVVTSCVDHNARVWSTNGLQRVPILAHEDAVLNAEYSPDGSMLLSSSLDGTVKLWHAGTLLPLEVNPIFRHGERVRHAAFCPDGRRILIAGIDGRVVVWDLSGQSPPPPRIQAVASGDGQRLMTLEGKGLKVTDEITGIAVDNSVQAVLPVEMMTLNWIGSLAAVVHPSAADPNQHQVTIFDTATGRDIIDGFAAHGPLWTTCLSDDGSKAAIIDGRTATIWDAKSGQQTAIHLTDDAGFAVFDGSTKRLATWQADANLINVWDTESGALCFPALEMGALVHTVRGSRDGKTLLAACWDQSLNHCYSQVWNLATGQPIGPRLEHGDGVLDCCFSPDLSLIACASEDFTASIWDASAGFRRIHTVRHHGHVRSVAFDETGDAIVTASDDKTARVWSARTGDPLTPALRHLVAVTNVTFLGNGDKILSVTRDGAAFIWTIKPDQRPAEDLWELADLLCSRSFDQDQNQNSGRNTPAAQTTWRRLRNLYPSDFSASESEIRRWHEFASEESKSNGDPFAAAFHARRSGTESKGTNNQSLVAERPSAGSN